MRFRWGTGTGELVPKIEPSIAGARCLVLDDEFLIALDIQQVLEQAGASNVTCLAYAAEALDKLRTGGKFDFAVIDVTLGGAAQDGPTVASELTRLNVPFVFLTGMRPQDKSLRQFPGVPVVEKPYEAALLVDGVLRALGRR
jgi:two-component system, response regulator PdtaR